MPSEARGVPHIRAYPPSVVPLLGFAYCPFTLALSCVVGVGTEAPPAIPLMRGTNLASGQDSPFCIIPELGQVPKDGSEPPRKDVCGVFQEEVAGSYDTGDS